MSAVAALDAVPAAPRPRTAARKQPPTAPVLAIKTRFDACWLGRFSGNEIRVLSKIADYTYTSGRYFAADATIAAQLRLSRGGVNRLLAGLEDRSRDGSGAVRSEYNRRTGTMSRRVRALPEGALAVCVSAYSRDVLPGSRFSVYCFLSLRALLDEPTSIQQIATGCRVSVGTARQAVGDLVADGWVSRDGADGAACRYSVHPVPLRGVATQMALFPQPTQSARPEGAVEPCTENAEGPSIPGVCIGQLPLPTADPTDQPPPENATGTPAGSVTSPPAGSVTQSSPLDQALVIRQWTVDGRCSREAATPVPRDTGAREGRVGHRRQRLTLIDGTGGPLRGEQPKDLHHRDHEQQPPVGANERPLRLVSVPRPPKDLKRALAPVMDLWERLQRPGARAVVVQAARGELGRIAPWTGRERAVDVLAERLTWHLDEQGGCARVADPMGWLLGRGLPRRDECPLESCDGGVRLDTGRTCETCQMRIGDRRSLRRILAADVGLQMPDATPGVRREVLEERLRERTRLKAEERAAALEIHRARQERRARELASRHAECQASAQARHAVPCEDCGATDAAGLCTTCGSRRTTKAAVAECVNLAIASSADLRNPADVAHWARRAQEDLRERMLSSRSAAADRQMAAACDLVTAQHAADEYRDTALALLGRCPEAEAEATLAYEACMRAAHRYRSPGDARTAANQARLQARQRTAQHLLTTRLAFVLALRQRGGTTVVATEAEPNDLGAGRARALVPASCG